MPRSSSRSLVALQRLLRTHLLTGLLFLLLPGTFLGVWNRVSSSGRHSLAGLSPSWLKASARHLRNWSLKNLRDVFGPLRIRQLPSTTQCFVELDYGKESVAPGQGQG